MEFPSFYFRQPRFPRRCCTLIILLLGPCLIFWGQAQITGTTPPLDQMIKATEMITLEEHVGVFSFQHRSGATVVQLKGTQLAPQADGNLKIESKAGYLEIDINRNEITGMPRAVRWGQDFLTYVLWAVSLDGRAQNLGELQFDQRGELPGLNVTTTYQAFWLMVTAEPHFAVSEPSDVVVMVSKPQNESETSNIAQAVGVAPIFYTHYAAVYRKTIDSTGEPEDVPLEVIQARQAVYLAESAGILKFPTPADQPPLEDELRTRSTLELAREYLNRAEEAAKIEKPKDKIIIQFARTAAQTAENARALAVGGVGQIYINQLTRQLDKSKALNAELTQANQSMDAELRNLRTDFADVSAQRQTVRGQLSECMTLNARLQGLLDSNRIELEQVRRDKRIICDELRNHLESLGQITEEGSNLVLTLASDILFDFDKFALRPEAREGLAKLATLQLLLFRDVPIKFEGHTDWVGAEDYNQWLSEQRALRVAEYLLQERIKLYSGDLSLTVINEQMDMVKQLLAMDFGQSQGRDRTRRNTLLASLGSLVEGFGYRKLAENVQGKDEKNRRVEIIFSQPEGQSLSRICDSVSQVE